MLGPPKPRRLDEPVAVSLEELVPTNHFYRHLEARLDLSFVRDWVRDLYAERGRPSIDPVVVFKLQLVMVFEGIRFGRQVIETARLHLAHRWYLGYALDEALPDHSSLTRIRQRLGVGVFQRVFEQVVDLCQTVGLVWGREFYVDATQGEANAGIRSLVPLTDFEHRSPLIGRDVFTSDAERDQYCCPQEHVLSLARSKRTEGVMVYRGDPTIGNACPVKEHCTTSDRGRTMQRAIYKHYLKKVRSYHATEPYRKAIRKRQVWVEPLFAAAKEWHGVRRLR
jgi:transposase